MTEDLKKLHNDDFGNYSLCQILLDCREEWATNDSSDDEPTECVSCTELTEVRPSFWL